MRMSPRTCLCHAITLILLLVLTGCVKRMSPVGVPSQSASDRSTLQSLQVLDEPSRVKIVVTSDRPFTYTSYKATDPAKIVVDLAQTEPGKVSTPTFSAGNVKKIEVERQSLGGGVLTRLEILLVKDADFTVNTDPADKTKLLVSVINPEAELKGTEPKAAAASAPPAEEKSSPVASAATAPAAAAAAAAAEPKGEVAPKPAEEAKPVPAPEAAPMAPVAPVAVVETIPSTPKGEEAKAKVDEAASPTEVKPRRDEAPHESAPAPATSSAPTRALREITTDTEGVLFTFNEVPETFNTFRLRKPERMVIDIFGTKSALRKNLVPINAFGVSEARIGITPDKLRIVLDTSQETFPNYEVTKVDSSLRIHFLAPGEKRTPKAVAAAPKSPAAPGEVAVAPLASPPVKHAAAVSVTSVKKPVAKKVGKSAAPSSGSLEAIDFKVSDGMSRISIKLSGECVPGRPTRGPHGFSLSIGNCQVPKALQRGINTSAFGVSVLSITPYQLKAKTGEVARLLVKVKGNPSYTVRREGGYVYWDFKNPSEPKPVEPPEAATKEKAAPAVPASIPSIEEEFTPPRTEEPAIEIPASPSAKKAYKGRRVTLEFSDADVRKIFQLIAEVSNLNFLVSDDVTGTISLKLVNVPWDQALDVILDAKDLGMQREGNIVQIKPKSRMKNQADEDRAAKSAVENSMELRAMVFQVNYATVADIQKQFESVKSSRGKISTDERTNRLIVNDISTKLDEMEKLLKVLDLPEKQVMIEARIVEATTNFTRDLGVQWGLHYRDGAATFANLNTVDTGFGGVVSTSPPSSAGNGGIAMGMSFGKLNSNIQLDMRLSAAATVGQVKVISTPKVVTLNNKAAKISQGQSIPYQTTSAEGTKTEFVEAALTLEVTPHITADGSVSMKIKASNNSPGTGSPPPINKKEATTELLVANGETTVIGGIYQDSDTETDTGVPFLSDIPLLGWLFKSNSKVKSKTELLIFITPKIVS